MAVKFPEILKFTNFKKSKMESTTTTPKKPKIIFLDVDGVLANSRCQCSDPPKEEVIAKYDDDGIMQYALEIRCLKLLHEIV